MPARAASPCWVPSCKSGLAAAVDPAESAAMQTSRSRSLFTILASLRSLSPIFAKTEHESTAEQVSAAPRNADSTARRREVLVVRRARPASAPLPADSGERADEHPAADSHAGPDPGAVEI